MIRAKNNLTERSLYVTSKCCLSQIITTDYAQLKLNVFFFFFFLYVSIFYTCFIFYSLISVQVLNTCIYNDLYVCLPFRAQLKTKRLYSSNTLKFLPLTLTLVKQAMDGFKQYNTMVSTRFSLLRSRATAIDWPG